MIKYQKLKKIVSYCETQDVPASTSFGVGPTYRTQITKHHIKTKEEETLTLVREMGEKIANATGHC